jgi:formamidopyrimidine-DNA glycosylase
MAFELPEAIHIAGQMNKELNGKKIERAEIDEKESASQIRMKMINLNAREFSKKLTGRTIKSVRSQGKGIYVDMGDNLYFICGSETSGKLLYHKDRNDLPSKYNIRLDFTDGSSLTYRIIAWGWGQVLSSKEIAAHRYLGQEEVSLIDESEFTFEVFNDYLNKYENKTIKFILIRQGEALSGIGNGYLQDILFKAKIHPKRKARDISEAERKNLYKIIKQILKEATKLGGRDSEVDLYGQAGKYRVILDKRVKDQPCPECGTTIEKSNILGSTCYVCPTCQK